MSAFGAIAGMLATRLLIVIEIQVLLLLWSLYVQPYFHNVVIFYIWWCNNMLYKFFPESSFIMIQDLFIIIVSFKLLVIFINGTSLTLNTISVLSGNNDGNQSKRAMESGRGQFSSDAQEVPRKNRRSKPFIHRFISGD